jgi:hypothetical protein
MPRKNALAPSFRKMCCTVSRMFIGFALEALVGPNAPLSVMPRVA